MPTRHRAHRSGRVEPTASRAERREALLDAATAAIRRDGSALSMDALAAEAGVTKPILYRHFGDRAGLVHALAVRFALGLVAELEAALAAAASPREQLAATIDAYLAFVERDPEVYRFVAQRPETAEARAGFVEQIGNRVALVLGEQLRALGADSGGAEVLGHAMVGMVHAAGDWWVAHRSLPRSFLVDQLTTVLWSGLEGMVR